MRAPPSPSRRPARDAARGPRSARLVRAVLTLAACILGACGELGRELPLSEPVLEYAGTWQYRYGSSPATADKLLAFAQPPGRGGASDGGWQPTTDLGRPGDRGDHDELWLRTRLVGPPIKDPIFYSRTIDQAAEVYLDGRLLTRIGVFERYRKDTFSAAPPVYVPLGPDYAGKTLTFRIRSANRSLGLARAPLLGGRSELLVHVFRAGLDEICTGVLLVTFGIAGAVLYFVGRREFYYLYFSGFSLTVGLYCITRSHVRVFLFENVKFWWAIEIPGLALTGVFITAFTSSLFGEGILRLRRWLIYAYLAYITVGSALVLGGVVNIMATLFPLQIMLLITIIYIVGTALVNAKRGDSDAKILAAGWLCAALPSVYDILASIGVFRVYLVLSHYSAMIVVLALGVVLARRFAALDRRLRDYSSVLQLSLASTNALDAEQHAQVALEQVRSLWEGELALLFLGSPGSDRLELFAGRDASGSMHVRFAEVDAALLTAVRTRQRVLFSEQSSLAIRSTNPPVRCHSVAAPLIAQGQLIGVLYLEIDKERHTFRREDTEILLGLCNQIALSIMTARALRLEFETALAQRRLGEQGALLSAAARMAQGQLGAPIEVPESSELVPLARALDAMRQDLQQKIQRLESNNAEIRQLNDELRRQIDQRSRRVLELALRSEDQRQNRKSHFAAGSLIGEHYRVVGLLGQGAMGSVYEVERTTDGRRLAAKVLTARADKTTMVRFAREAQLLARLTHPNLISIVDVDVMASGVLYLVMELVRGTTLKLCQDRYGDARFVLPVLRQIAAGLHAIHESGIVHRDLKPANVLIAAAGPEGGAPSVKLVDFGISTLSAPEQGDGASSRSGRHAASPLAGSDATRDPATTESQPSLDDDSLGAPGEHLTQTGVVVGTPMYMAPECGDRSRSARPPADVFSFGVIAFELLTKKLPFLRPPFAIVTVGDPLPSPALRARRPDLPPGLLLVLESCLQQEPERRPTASTLLGAFAMFGVPQ